MVIEANGHNSDNFSVERGKRIKLLRNIADLDRKSTSELANISISTLKFWETGYFGGINENGAKKILAAMKNNGIDGSYEWLMFGDLPFPTVKEKIKKQAHPDQK